MSHAKVVPPISSTTICDSVHGQSKSRCGRNSLRVGILANLNAVVIQNFLWIGYYLNVSGKFEITLLGRIPNTNLLESHRETELREEILLPVK
jgi:hypothetical protein